MRILLTGGTGLLGAAIARACLAAGHEVTVLSRRPLEGTRLAPLVSRLSLILGDLDRPEGYAPALMRLAPEAMIHAGWWGVGGAERNDTRQLANALATAHLVDTALEAGARTLLGIGSQAEYGPCGTATHEGHALNPTTLYGIAKAAAGRTLLQKGGEAGARGIWGRVYSLYGHDEEGCSLLPTLARDFRSGRAPALTGCEQIWEFLHVRDAADAILALIEKPAAGGVFNIGSGEPISLRDAVLMLRDVVGGRVEPRFGAVAYRPDQVMHLEADISRIRRVTGWSPRIGLREGLAEAFPPPALDLAS